MQRRFLRDFLICLVPLLIATGFIVDAYLKYQQGRGGFKLGVDLVGGTILVYEVDQQASQSTGQQPVGPRGQGYDIAELAAALKRRIDPADLKNVVIRPVGTSRVEIILPTGGQSSNGKEDFSQEEVERTKNLIREVGSLEFQIVANQTDDRIVITAVQEFYKDPANKEAIDLSQLEGRLPPLPPLPEGEPYRVHDLDATYAWVEIGKVGRRDMGLHNSPDERAESGHSSALWTAIDAAAKRGEPYVTGDEVIMRRETRNRYKTEADNQAKQFDYFILTRSSDSVKVGGNVTVTANVGTDGRSGKPCIDFAFNSEGGKQFHDITERNLPAGKDDRDFHRRLAILIDGQLISSPRVNSIISDRGQITGNFTFPQVKSMVTILRSGALPATLKGEPVSSNAISPNLGKDTIDKGKVSVAAAFLVVLIFMIYYYRFAGFVATVALLANLILTVGGMVLLNATFTLPGLAGLVLMLGMAVDANVLIYERIREERERGAGLAMAIRNGYDRAFPTIIDTHLSSIFTAIVLYAVGNDQLKGFGVSLTLGLIISLFTSLFMTRLMFDYWLSRHWIKSLTFKKLFARPTFNFMKIRRAMFTLTAISAILGITLFLWRGKEGLNVDFNGGIAYDGQLRDGREMDIAQLRATLDQTGKLEVASVEAVPDASGKFKNVYRIKFADGETRDVILANPPEGATEAEQLANLKARASHLPDWSVEQRFRGNSIGQSASGSFTIRTTEKEAELVQLAIERLFRDENGSLLSQTDFESTPKEKSFDLKFVDNAGNPVLTSPSYVKAILERRFRTSVAELGQAEPFALTGIDDGEGGRHTAMKLELTNETAKLLGSPADQRAKTEAILKQAREEFKGRPQPERLEAFDATLASETRDRALYAILASWAAILLFLWFRFGSWTFGAAAVICLIHDLFFTLGVIALCHYLYPTMFGTLFMLQDFKIDLPAVAALLTLVGYSVNDTIVVFDRIREVRGKNPQLTEKIINDSVNQTLSRTVLAALTVFLVVVVLYFLGGEGIHLFAFVMVMGVLVGTYSSIYIAAPLLLIFGEGDVEARQNLTPAARPVPVG